MNEKQVAEFENIEDQIECIYNEIGKLSKRKPDEVINTFKLKIINDLVNVANNFFKGGELPIKDFSQFDETQLPTNSDIVFVLSQYLNKLDYFRYQNTSQSLGSYYWVLANNVKVRTKPPKFYGI